MRHENRAGFVFSLIAAVILLCASVPLAVAAGDAVSTSDGNFGESQEAAGLGIIVHSKFGGQIFGFDIDANGTEGLISESQRLDDGSVLAAVETFDQRTGKILKVVSKTQTPDDDFVTLGVAGGGIGLVMREHEVSFLHIRRSFHVLNPLNGNKFTGVWTPPVDRDHIIQTWTRTLGTSQMAFWVLDNSGGFIPTVFGSDIATNTSGPMVPLTNPSFDYAPVIALDTAKNHAVLGAQTFDSPFVAPTFAVVDLASGEVNEFTGVGLGNVNGIAIDPVSRTACTTTEIDFSVQFYDLDTQTGFSQFLPGATSQFFSGADVEFDPVHKLFFVAQPNSSTAPGTSSIHVYDVDGNLVESIDGFHFSNTFNVIPARIALNPSKRTGFVDGPDDGVTSIQAFKY